LAQDVAQVCQYVITYLHVNNNNCYKLLRLTSYNDEEIKKTNLLNLLFTVRRCSKQPNKELLRFVGGLCNKCRYNTIQEDDRLYKESL